MSGVFSVVMLNVLKRDFENFLKGRGLALQETPASDEERDAGIDTYVVVIPKGSPLEKYLTDKAGE